MSRPTTRLENVYRKQGYANIVGLDEAGKGAWAGPVVAGAVLLPEKIDLPKLNDSKLLRAPQREELYDLIVNGAVAWGVGVVDAYLVDEIGLAQAHRQAMQDALREMSIQIDLVLADGIGINRLGFETICVVKGDQKVRSIAAASILAKVTRDRLMKEFAKEYPGYGFDEHKGYGTQRHQEAIAQHGICPLHRLSYSPIQIYWQQNLFASLQS